jgi:hypothetical protein
LFPPPPTPQKRKKETPSWVAKLQLTKHRKGHPEKPITINAKTI